MMRDPRYVLARVIWYLPRFARVFWGIMRDPRIPSGRRTLQWCLLVFGIGYFLFPIDVVTDLLVPFGWVDDIVVLYLCLWGIVRLCPRQIVAEHVARAARRG
jgi:uncharacterized membrane protein YkvA (DUF1232 family)